MRLDYFFPGILASFPKGITPDISADWGLAALMNAANNYSLNPVTILSNLTSNTLTATQVIRNGLLLRTGAPGGAVTDQWPTAVLLMQAMQGPGNIPLDGTYSEPVRIINSTGQTITLTTNTGLTLIGTMTIEDGTWREFYLTPRSATTMDVLNIGAGELAAPGTFTNLIVTGNLAVGGNTTLTGTLGVTGATTLTSLSATTINASGAVTFSALTANSFLFSGVGGLLTTTAAPTNGQLLIGSTGAAPVAASLTGTANQVVVTPGAGSITLSGPQDIAAGSSPTFTALTLSGLTASSFIYSGATKQITSTAAPTNGQLLIGSTGAVPVAAALTGTANQVTVTNGAGSITLALPQSIATSSNVQFGSVGIGMVPSTPLDITSAANTGFRITDSTVTGIFFPSTTATHSLVIGTTSAHPLILFTNNTSAVNITSTGDVGVNTATPNYRAGGRAVTVEGSTGPGFETSSTQADATGLNIGYVLSNYQTNSASHRQVALINFNTEGATANQRGGQTVFFTKPNGSTSLVERQRIAENGDVTWNSSTPNPIANRINGIAFLGTASAGVFLMRMPVNSSGFGINASTGIHFNFYTDNGATNVAAGAISSNGSTTTYAASSDYRRKENVRPLSNALTRLQTLPVYRFNFKGEALEWDGFFAHEAATVVPGAVVGEKDAIDDTGKPVYQLLDYAKFVPLLVAAVQELSGQIQALQGHR